MTGTTENLRNNKEPMGRAQHTALLAPFRLLLQAGKPAGPPSNAFWNCWRVMAVLCASLLVPDARADAAAEEAWPRVWLNPGFYSHHFDSDKGLRNNNIGLGVEVSLARDHGLMAGSYINSNRARTRYGSYLWRPLHWQLSGFNVGAGIAVSALEGYPKYRNGGWFVAPLPLLSVEGETLGVNLSIIPTIANRIDGAWVVQVKLRVR